MPIMGDRNDPRRNGEGYEDLTAYRAIQRADRYQQDPDKLRHSKIIGAILRICELAGYRVECKIILRDQRTGKLWD